MEENYRDDSYRDYREEYRNNRDSYRDNYRDYRDEYGRNQRDEYGRNQRDRYGRNRRSYRDYRNYRSQEDYYTCLEDIVEDGMELARAYEDVVDMATNSKDKQMLTKLAEKQKEHYRMTKELLEKGM